MELENQELFYLAFCHAIRKEFSGEICQTPTSILNVNERHVAQRCLCWEVQASALSVVICCRQHGNISDKFRYGDYDLLGCDALLMGNHYRHFGCLHMPLRLFFDYPEDGSSNLHRNISL
jgi:hypothetical protein